MTDVATATEFQEAAARIREIVGRGSEAAPCASLSLGNVLVFPLLGGDDDIDSELGYIVVTMTAATLREIAHARAAIDVFGLEEARSHWLEDARHIARLPVYAKRIARPLANVLRDGGAVIIAPELVPAIAEVRATEHRVRLVADEFGLLALELTRAGRAPLFTSSFAGIGWAAKTASTARRQTARGWVR